jgi:acetyl-CoA carboxylase biotin carboxyl carrier protein
VEARRIEQAVDPFAHREPAGVVLALDLLGPAHLAGERLAAPQLFDIGFPAQIPPHLSTRPAGDYSIPRAGQTRAGVMAEVTVRSELNAVVWKIEVAIGAAVGEGDSLFILESMKMEIPVTAPRAGTVRALAVAEGEQVAEGQPLAILQF